MINLVETTTITTITKFKSGKQKKKKKKIIKENRIQEPTDKQSRSAFVRFDEPELVPDSFKNKIFHSFIHFVICSEQLNLDNPNRNKPANHFVDSNQNQK